MNGDGGSNEEDGQRVVDGGTVTTMDEGVLYTVVRKAVEDAILGVIGMLLLVGIAFVLVSMGGGLLLESAGVGSATFGAILLVSGLYLAAATLGIIPPIREWS